MTAKQAIKARCRDCLAGSRVCTFTDCALKGLAGAKGKAKGGNPEDILPLVSKRSFFQPLRFP
jgi:hypothetical protein